MNCPKDGTAMRERERESGDRELILMDVCPSCGGIWLDRGELEKLTVAEERYYDSGRPRRDDDDDDDDRRRGGSGQGLGPSGSQRRKRGGFLGNILDSFGE